MYRHSNIPRRYRYLSVTALVATSYYSTPAKAKPFDSQVDVHSATVIAELVKLYPVNALAGPSVTHCQVGFVDVRA